MWPATAFLVVRGSIQKSSNLKYSPTHHSKNVSAEANLNRDLLRFTLD